MTPDPTTLYEAIDVTWAPASIRQEGPWTIREGQGGGQRVSAATARAPVQERDLDRAEEAMRSLGQTPLFMIRSGEDALDEMLAGRGYRVADPVNYWLAPVETLSREPLPRARLFTIWEPLAIQLDLWAEGGIGPGRIRVMERVRAPRTSILGRHDQVAAATAFVARHEGVALVHALEVVPSCRRQGMAGLICRQAAIWARDEGAGFVGALCTRANTGANALYASLGMRVVEQYHYRKAEDKDRP